jgi:hypothetical protein
MLPFHFFSQVFLHLFSKTIFGKDSQYCHIASQVLVYKRIDESSKNGGIKQLPSSKSWSFPPRPWTHHIRWIEPDANNPDYVFAAIEAGALVQSHDGGKTWIDRDEQVEYCFPLLSFLYRPMMLGFCNIAAADWELLIASASHQVHKSLFHIAYMIT